ncbi:MAG: hypothetical protein VB977_06855 [Pseudohongiellaceae bacterium]|jgi:hypothetical protein
MVNQNRQVLCSKLVALSLALWLATVSGVATAQILHRFGQSIQPIFEGFEKNPDGSFTMWFGYLNRNYDELPNVAIGVNNSFQAADGVTDAGPISEDLLLDDPGPTDRRQPTYFYPRRQQFVFGVQVPADFVGKELVWNLTYNGETRVAVGTLEQGNIWSVDEGVWSANRGRGVGGRSGVAYANQPPTVRMVGVEGQLSTTVGRPVTLRTFASDDGLPGARENPRRRPQQDPLPNDLPVVGGGLGRNSPKSQGIINYTAADETGLAITWVKYRGPGQVKFDSAVTSLVASGEETAASASFSQSGTYVLRAYADDGAYTRSADVTVVVQ